MLWLVLLLNIIIMQIFFKDQKNFSRNLVNYCKIIIFWKQQKKKLVNKPHYRSLIQTFLPDGQLIFLNDELTKSLLKKFEKWNVFFKKKWIIIFFLFFLVDKWHFVNIIVKFFSPSYEQIKRIERKKTKVVSISTLFCVDWRQQREIIMHQRHQFKRNDTEIDLNAVVYANWGKLLEDDENIRFWSMWSLIIYFSWVKIMIFCGVKNNNIQPWFFLKIKLLVS